MERYHRSAKQRTVVGLQTDATFLVRPTSFILQEVVFVQRMHVGISLQSYLQQVHQTVAPVMSTGYALASDVS